MSSPNIRVPLIAAVAIVVGNMVGSGVFISLGFQVAVIPSGFPVMLLWFIGGVLAFCGAVNYAELSAAFPRSGGEYQLLSRIYHPGVGFVSGWLSMTVGFPAPVAAAALVIGDYACLIAGGERGTVVSSLVAAGVVVAVTGVHLISVAFSGRFQWMATGLKVLLVLTFAVCGFVLAEAQPVKFVPQPGDGALVAGREFFSSLLWVFYAYTGWNAATYIAGEIENPERNVPRALLIGTAIVTVLYLGVIAAMLYAAPMPEMAAAQHDAAFVAAQHIFGNTGGSLMAVLIAAGLVSAISAMTWAGPRVMQQMGRDYPFIDVLARTDSNGVPWMAVSVQSAVVLLLIFASNVEDMVNCTAFLLQLVLLLTVWGVIHLRIFQPNLARPCRAWGYPWTTILFLVVIGFTLAQILSLWPGHTRWGMGILITGVAFYWLARPAKANGK
jgi:basic amino acid/polyamine antiporter, APA family